MRKLLVEHRYILTHREWKTEAELELEARQDSEDGSHKKMIGFDIEWERSEILDEKED